MKTSSAKAKGRKACKLVQELFYKHIPYLKPGDIEVTSSGATGEDLKLSPLAREYLPFVIECKNQESINIWAAYEQAEQHGKDNQELIPIVFYKRNRSQLMVTLSADDFMYLMEFGDKL